ncbi:YncE family protein [Solibacillus sp. FSL R7-0682]|uniref:YncE family protein n=1 Tax=Solibacillus sp. FSL R7-0682 TaxID=2921690 RepID=UPI0030F8599C
MKTIRIVFLLLLIVFLTSCSHDHFEGIDPHRSFIASVNILEPSIVYYDQSAKEIATWSLNKAYTGATLVGHDAVLLFGNQLTEADLYELSSGKHMKSIQTGLGVTNAYFDDQTDTIFMTNSKTNELSSYTKNGELNKSVPLGNYPMAMIAYDGKLYVINYKDTILSIISTTTLQRIDEWQIPKSSNGLFVSKETNELWIGGHGEGSKPNDAVNVYDLTTGEKINEIPMPLMPVAFSQKDGEVAVVSHGTNMLYVAKLNGDIMSKQEIAANPFAVAHFKDQLVIAGYDDHTLYFIQNNQILHHVETGNGPFQLLVREG